MFFGIHINKEYICCHRSVGLKFDLAKSSLNHCVRRVVQALCDIASDFIKWPSVDRMNAIMEKFARIAGLQNVIGAIDCTHIEIPAPYVSIYNVILFST